MSIRSKRPARHTPGPWLVDRRADRASNSIAIIAPNSNEDVVTVFSEKDLSPVDLANARLIAAAPKLLEALREISINASEDPIRAAALEAIAGAEFV